MLINLLRFYFNDRLIWRNHHSQHDSPTMTLPIFKKMRNDISTLWSQLCSRCRETCSLLFGKSHLNTYVFIWIFDQRCHCIIHAMVFLRRNLNTIRAIARRHGDPIDRPVYMAKYAQQSIYQTHRFSLVKQISWLIRRLKFDFYLLKMKLHFWFIRTYLDTLALLGRSSANSKQILNFNPHIDSI